MLGLIPQDCFLSLIEVLCGQIVNGTWILILVHVGGQHVALVAVLVV